MLTTNFNGQLDILRAEKAALEKALEADRASKSQDSSLDKEPAIVCYEYILFAYKFTQLIQVALREEHDKLLAEKESWVISSASGNVASDVSLDEAKRLWEIEKTELLQARDHAISQVKVW